MEQLRGTQRGSGERVVFHIDVNSAFLSWEAVHRIYHYGAKVDLRTIPSAVGGDIEKRHGIILAKSIPAKAYHIHTGEPVVSAKQKCPELELVPPNYDLYQQCSHAFMEVLRQYTSVVEPYSVDEAFLDVTEVLHLYASHLALADEIRCRIRDELGFTVNIGISCNKFLAKMASDFTKPDRTHTLFPEEVPAKLWPLPVRDMLYVGHSTAKCLYGLGVHTIGELAAMDVRILRHHLKKHGETVWAYANGIDDSPVIAEAVPNKGYSNSTTMPYDVTDGAEARQVLLALCETVAKRLRADGMKAEVVSVGIKDHHLSYASHQMVLENPTNITIELYEYVCKLFGELWKGVPIRLLGVSASRVTSASEERQQTLFDTRDYEKLERADAAIDAIRRKHGIDAVKRATFLNSSVDHLSGGIAREKRSVDYSRELSETDF